jgi:hypothetical protein
LLSKPSDARPSEVDNDADVVDVVVVIVESATDSAAEFAAARCAVSTTDDKSASCGVGESMGRGINECVLAPSAATADQCFAFASKFSFALPAIDIVAVVIAVVVVVVDDDVGADGACFITWKNAEKIGLHKKRMKPTLSFANFASLWLRPMPADTGMPRASSRSPCRANSAMMLYSVYK